MLLVRILKAKVQTATKTQMKIQTIQTIQTRNKGLVCLSYNDGVVNEQPVTVALSSLVFFSSAPPLSPPPPPFFCIFLQNGKAKHIKEVVMALREDGTEAPPSLCRPGLHRYFLLHKWLHLMTD